MNPRHEIEIKLRVDRRRTLEERLRLLGFRELRGRHFESNCLFDFADRRLYKAGRLVRLRHANGEGILTFKGPAVRSGLYKIREEVETRVEDASLLAEVLEGIGLTEVFRYEKYRTVYGRVGPEPEGHRKGRAKAWGNSLGPEGPKLLYDETPIGDYVELEGPERWIDEVARQLGYGRGEYITASYGRLYREHCRARGASPGDMIFAVSRRGAKERVKPILKGGRNTGRKRGGKS